MNEAMVTAVVRHALTTFGGAFLAKWGLGGGEIDAIAGIVGTAAGLAWSVWDKKKARETGL
jgi:hypothetical protein